MKISETAEKAENIIEKGEELSSERKQIQERLASAYKQLNAAKKALKHAAAVNENGEPSGDIGLAEADVAAAQLDVEYYQDELNAIDEKIESNNQEKYGIIDVLEEYTEGQQENLSIVSQLESKAFSKNAAGLVAAMVANMNLAESTKVALYASMGVQYTGITASAGVGGTSNGSSNGVSGAKLTCELLKERLGWTEHRINTKCFIGDDNVVYLRTDKEELENKASKGGVPYRRNRITHNGIQIEGVFPVFDSVCDVQLSSENYTATDYSKTCTEQLAERIKNDPELARQFTYDQLEEINNGETPSGYVWHHNEEPGKMQLVRKVDHDRMIGGAAHTGGNSIWGYDSVGKLKRPGKGMLD